MAFFTVDEIKQANEAIGHHWFEQGAIRFFRSRVSDPVIGGRYFVSSERGPDEVRRYTLRVAAPDGSIGTVGAMGDYRSKRTALTAAREQVALDLRVRDSAPALLAAVEQLIKAYTDATESEAVNWSEVDYAHELALTAMRSVNVEGAAVPA